MRHERFCQMEQQSKEVILESLRSDMAEIGKYLREVATRVIFEGISDYPVFIASHEMVDIGKPIFDRDSLTINWFFNATLLEDLVRRNLIRKDRVEDFKRTYGDATEKACIFVIYGDAAEIVFIPYPEAEESADEGF